VTLSEKIAALCPLDKAALRHFHGFALVDVEVVVDRMAEREEQRQAKRKRAIQSLAERTYGRAK
jgi:hypothetical protein